MKLSTLLLTPLIFLFSCNGGGKKFKHSPIDSSNVVIIHYSPQYSLREDRAKRFFVDSFMFVGDSLVQKKQWTRFKAYIVNNYYPILDSLKNPLKTKDGKDSMQSEKVGIPAKNIIFDINVDSLTKIYIDTTNKK